MPSRESACGGTGGELWEKSGLAKGNVGDTYTWGPVDIPSDHGKVIQVSAGASCINRASKVVTWK